MAKDFFSHSVNRSKKEVKQVFFTDFLSKHFPSDYPQSFIDAVKQYNIHIPTLSKEDCKSFKEKLSALI